MHNSFYAPGSLFGRMQAHPLLVLFFGTGFLMVSLVLAQLVATSLAYMTWGVGYQRLADLMQVPAGASLAELTALKLTLGISQLLGFGLAGYTLAVGSGVVQQELAWQRPLPLQTLLWAGLCMLLLMPVLQALMLPADNLPLPDGLSRWIVESESKVEAALRPMLQDQLWLNLLVVALCPAIAEEVLFRGFVQSTLLRIMRPALAIWLQAVLFSALHFQFLGFVPRLLMGVFFGYLRLWSGSLWPAMLAHFVNNAVGVVVAYYAFNGVVDEKLVANDYAVPWAVVLGCALATAALLYRLYTQRTAPAAPTPHD